MKQHVFTTVEMSARLAASIIDVLQHRCNVYNVAIVCDCLAVCEPQRSATVTDRATST